MVGNGTYIGNDIEMAATDTYLILFRRNNEEDFLESCLLKRDAASSDHLCIGICRSRPTATKMNSRPKKWEYAFLNRQKVCANDKTLMEYIGQPIIKMANRENRIQIRYHDSTVYYAVQDEQFTMADLFPGPPMITDDTIGECLKYWNMGIHEDTNETENSEPSIGVTINTEKHMYIFQISPSSIYCRAARYGTCNKGVVFNQNFRQRKSASPETYMVEDNIIALQPLIVDEGMFETYACALERPDEMLERILSKQEFKVLCCLYGQKGMQKLTQRAAAELFNISRSTVSRINKKAIKILNSRQPSGNSIYWTVSSFTENQIVLNGCMGDTYYWDKPDRS